MASTFKSSAMQDNRPAIDPRGAGDTVTVPFTYELLVATVVDDIIELVMLPPYCVVVDLLVASDDVDSSTGLVWDCGLYADDDGVTVVDINAYISASTIGQAAGLNRMDEQAGIAIAPSSSKRVVCYTCTTAPTTGVVGTIFGWVQYRGGDHGI